MNGNLFDQTGPAEAAGEWFTAHCDGGSRGNPGPSGYGAVVEDAQGRVAAELSQFLGIQTNNYAEYSGLLAVLRWAQENKVKRLRVVSDSELMVKQMQGKYKVASPVLRPLFEDARKMARSFERFEISHTLRGGNKVADRLANEAMDKGMGRGPRAIPAGESGSGPAGGADRPGAVPNRPANHFGAGASTPRPQPQPTAPKPVRQVLEGYVKGGVIHLVDGELPDGVFVKIIRD